MRTLSVSGAEDWTANEAKKSVRSRYYDSNAAETFARMHAYQKHKLKINQLQQEREIIRLTGTPTDPKIAQARSLVGKIRSNASKYETNQRNKVIENKNRQIYDRICEINHEKSIETRKMKKGKSLNSIKMKAEYQRID